MEQSRRLFGPGAFYKSTLAIAVPIMLQQLIQSLVSLVDNFMVAGLGDVSMSGVNVAGQILFVFMVFLNTVCMTGGIFMTQFFGADVITTDTQDTTGAVLSKSDRLPARGHVSDADWQYAG